METTKSHSKSYDEAMLNSLPTEEVALPDHLSPLVEKTTFQEASSGSGVVFVDVADNEKRATRAVYRKAQSTGVLLHHSLLTLTFLFLTFSSSLHSFCELTRLDASPERLQL